MGGGKGIRMVQGEVRILKPEPEVKLQPDHVLEPETETEPKPEPETD